jgi:hypothetical protein
LCILFVTALNIRSFMADRSLELTTSVAMLTTALLGILVARDEFLVAGACAVIMKALLAWKEELGGFAKIVTVSEIRGALLLGRSARHPVSNAGQERARGSGAGRTPPRLTGERVGQLLHSGAGGRREGDCAAAAVL